MDFKKKFKTGRMWHEARKQEKKIRGMMVDFKRRAERRREYYERIKQDPAQFLQVHGQRCKIHLDPAIAQAADSPTTMMPWQGHEDNLIDRFDVRAHLDIIPENKNLSESPKTEDQELERRQINYERYRTLVQNDFFGVSEGKFLHQIYLEERFGPVGKPSTQEDEKKKLAEKKAAIGYVYEDSTPSSAPTLLHKNKSEDAEDDEEESDNEDLSDIDFDITVNVNELTIEQSSEMNSQAIKYGMGKVDFISYLHQDKDEADQLKAAKELEEEKAMYSGRKSRRERRALREKKLQGRRVTSPPSYAAAEPETSKPFDRNHSSSRSRSVSPVNAGQVTFITSFGGEMAEDDKKSLLKTSGNGSAKIETHYDKPSRSQVIASFPVQSSCSKPHNSSSSSSSSTSSSRRRNKRRSSHSKKYSRKSRSSSSSHSNSSSYSTSPHRQSSRNKRYRRSSSSKSRSRSSSTSRSRSRSRSISQRKGQPPLKSYYRHSLSRSNSELSLSSDEVDTKSDSSNNNKKQIRKSLPLLGKADSSSKFSLTPQEKLKRKMQALLNKQYKMDKKAELEKIEKQEQERVGRAEELREMAIKLRQRERERRHRMQEFDQDSDTASSSAAIGPSLPAETAPGSASSRQRSHSSSPERSPTMKSQVSTPSSSTTSTSRRRSSKSRSPSRSRSDRHSRKRSRSRSKNRGSSRSPNRRTERSSRYHSTRSRRSRSKSGSRSRTTRPLVDY